MEEEYLIEDELIVKEERIQEPLHIEVNFGQNNKQVSSKFQVRLSIKFGKFVVSYVIVTSLKLK